MGQSDTAPKSGRARYGYLMQIPATTHGTVDQGGSICGLEKKLEGPDTIHGPKVDGCRCWLERGFVA
jgi:hypothetical protein